MTSPPQCGCSQQPEAGRTPCPHTRPRPRGREAELDLVDAFVHDRTSRPGMLFLGITGIGKTTMLRAAGARAEATGKHVVWITGAPFESELPYSGLHQLLYALRPHLARLREPERHVMEQVIGLTGDEPAERLAVSAAVLALLTEAAAQSPIVLLLDDVQWIDVRSAEALAFVARRRRDLPGLVILAATSERGTPLEKADLHDHELMPLGETDAALLLHEAFPLLAKSVRTRLLGEALGNPLVLLELPTELSDRHRSAVEPLPEYLPMSHRLVERFGDGIRGLPVTTRRLLLITALNDTVSLSQIAEAIDHPNLVTALVPAEQGGLIEIRSYRPVFAHPVIRHLVVQLAPHSELLWAHGSLAEVVRHDSDLLARHLAGAAIGPDDRAADALAAAGNRAAARGQLTAAATALHRAARLSTKAVDRVERQAQAAHMAWQGGWHQWALRLNNDNAATSTYATAMNAYFRLFQNGEVDTAQRSLSLALADSSNTPSMHRMLLEMLFHVSVLVGDRQQWEVFDTALQRFDPQEVALVRMCRNIVTGAEGNYSVLRDRLIEMYRSSLSAKTQLDILSLFSFAAVAIRLDVAAELIRALRNVTPVESDMSGHTVAMFGTQLDALDCFHSGRWEEAAALAQEGTRLAEEFGFETFVCVFRGLMALLAASRGDTETAQELADAVLRWAVPRRIGLAASLAWQARSLTAVGSGDYEQAYAYASRVAPAGTVVVAPLNAPCLVLDLAEAALRTGRASQARNHVAVALRADFGNLSPRIALLTGAAAALVAPDEQTDALFRKTLAAPDNEHWPFEYARVRLTYGEWLRRNRDIGPARQQLSMALDLFDRLGARDWTARAGNELRATGIAVSRLADDTQGLTAQETAVAELAARGMTNKQIGARLNLSPRTVSGHLYKAFPKLGVVTRTGLRDALARQAGSHADVTAP